MNDNSMLYLVLLGFASGFINMFAGGGSMLVVPFLIFLGLPPHVANATNRVAIFLQNIVSTATFRQKKILNFKTDYPLLLPTTLGSILGAFTAVDIQAAVLQKMIGGLLVVMFFMILLDPNTWVKSNIEKAKARHPWVRFLIFLGIGFYGGFIQIGVGFFMLGGLVLGCGYDLLKANAFVWYDLVDWRTGLILACGNMAGAWIGTRLSVKWGAKYIRYILLLALVMVALKLFGIF